VYDDGKTIRIDPSNKFSIIKTVPIGIHTFTKARLICRNNTKIQLREYPLNAIFSVDEKKVFLLPIKVLAKGNDIPTGKRVSTGLENISEVDQIEAKTYFFKQKYSRNWEMIY
jgi:hypothetical protein